ncbi:MAG: hypothetical protein HYS22_02965 [Deltaproteobacteria bacterium]|nr:hypothetical protein [Deltaproteobacteria bacterium]
MGNEFNLGGCLLGAAGGAALTWETGPGVLAGIGVGCAFGAMAVKCGDDKVEETGLPPHPEPSARDRDPNVGVDRSEDPTTGPAATRQANDYQSFTLLIQGGDPAAAQQFDVTNLAYASADSGGLAFSGVARWHAACLPQNVADTTLSHIKELKDEAQEIRSNPDANEEERARAQELQDEAEALEVEASLLQSKSTEQLFVSGTLVNGVLDGLTLEDVDGRCVFSLYQQEGALTVCQAKGDFTNEVSVDDDAACQVGPVELSEDSGSASMVNPDGYTATVTVHRYRGDH